MTLDEALASVWRQVLVENANLVQIEERSYPVRRTARLRLRQVDFEFAGQALRGIEQNPALRSRWAEMAANGAKIMQFSAAGRYVANVVDGHVTTYESRERPHRAPGPGARDAKSPAQERKQK